MGKRSSLGGRVGAIPQVFDRDDDRYAEERAELRRLLRSEDGWAQARRTRLNAHYTSARVVQAMWHAARQLGVESDVRVLLAAGRVTWNAEDEASAW